MSLGGIAAIIAAIAFAVLVGFIATTLTKVTQVVNETKYTVQRLNTTIDVVTKDVDGLAIEVEGLLNKANTLVDDVNGKLSKTDPLFEAVGDLGESVSDLNDSTKEMVSNLVHGNAGRKRSKVSKFLNTARNISKASKKANRAVAPTDYYSPEEAEIEELESLVHDKQPSVTAGEIAVNLREEDHYE